MTLASFIKTIVAIVQDIKLLCYAPKQLLCSYVLRHDLHYWCTAQPVGELLQQRIAHLHNFRVFGNCLQDWQQSCFIQCSILDCIRDS